MQTFRNERTVRIKYLYTGICRFKAGLTDYHGKGTITFIVTKYKDEGVLKMSKTFLIICILITISSGTMLLAGCASSEVVSDKVTLQLNWFHEAEFMGYYVAETKGFYEDARLDVEIIEGGPGIQARLHILDGRADFAISSFSEQQQLLESGEPAVAVMTVFQIPPLVMFALTDSGIKEPKDLIGKRVGIKNNYWRSIAHETLSNAGIDPSEIIEVQVEADAKYLLYDREVDIWMGYAHDEPIEAQMAGYDITNIYPADYGVGGYEGLLLVNQSTLDQRPDIVERFVRASQRGWRYAVENPDEAAEIMTVWQPRDNLEFQKLAVRALIPLVDIPQATVGWIDAARWELLMGPTYDVQNPGYTMQFLQE
jgi:ABC-type nitrate/sulfonate/bicarbonate transport system substrate-binding protein